MVRSMLDHAHADTRRASVWGYGIQNSVKSDDTALSDFAVQKCYGKNSAHT